MKYVECEKKYGNIICEHLLDGLRANLNGTFYPVVDQDENTLVLLDSVRTNLKEYGFVNEIIHVSPNGNIDYSKNWLKIINKSDVNELYNISFIVYYNNVKCAINFVNSKANKIQIKYIGEISDETRLMKLGFTKLEGDYSRCDISFVKELALDKVDISIEENNSDLLLKSKYVNTNLLLQIKNELVKNNPSFRKVLLGTYGYHITNYSFSNDIALIFDFILSTYSDVSNNLLLTKANYIKNFINDLIMLDKKGQSKYGKDENLFWIGKNNKILFVAENNRYVIYLKLSYYELLFIKSKNKELPFDLDKTFIGNFYTWVDKNLNIWTSKKWGTPLYFDNQLICKDFSRYVEDTLSTILQ